MKTFIQKIPKLYGYLGLSMSFGLLLLISRYKITDSFFYSFLIWNLFLAMVPFFITQMARHLNITKNATYKFILVFIAWLLFLPNSPYIITDLIHLQNENSTFLWLDLFLVFVFAFNGLILGVLSLLDMYAVLQERYNKTIANYAILKVCLLSGFGIYLGRFLRFNTWDVLTKPKLILIETLHSLQKPKVWLITLGFGGFLWILFLVLQCINTATIQNK